MHPMIYSEPDFSTQSCPNIKSIKHGTVYSKVKPVEAAIPFHANPVATTSVTGAV